METGVVPAETVSTAQLRIINTNTVINRRVGMGVSMERRMAERIPDQGSL